MNKRYRFRFTCAGSAVTSAKDIDASSPISAINQFHSFIQLVTERADDRRTIIRPALRFDQYKVVSLHHIYHDASLHRDPCAQPIVESRIDYPASANPDLLCPERAGRSAFAETGTSQPEFCF